MAQRAAVAVWKVAWRDVDLARFLDRHWQKRPLLVRGALPDLEPLLTPEELAGLACEDDVESRIVLEAGERPWEVRHGPFAEEDFARLPDGGWTLLVHEVDRVVPAVAELLERFRFAPNWRIDDVMVSYAADRGGVGAHVDDYDVFLVQGPGKRRWEIAREPVMREELLDEADARVLASFEPDESWVLEPGDLLYLPPRIAHRGAAVGPSMTYSIGFRAPSHQDIAGGFLGHAIETLDPALRYADPDLASSDDPGEITGAAVDRVHGVLLALVRDRHRVEDWFGSFATAPRRETGDSPPPSPYTADDLARALREGATLRRASPARLSYIRRPAGTVVLFAAGERRELSSRLGFAAPLLCGVERLWRDTLAEHLADREFAELLLDLCNRGVLVVESRD